MDRKTSTLVQLDYPLKEHDLGDGSHALAVTVNERVKVGTPASAIAASLATALGVADADLLFTAKAKGVLGDGISIEYIDTHRDNTQFALGYNDQDFHFILGADDTGVAATADIGGGADGTVTITCIDGGTWADSVQVVDDQDADAPVLVEWDYLTGILLVHLGTDALGAPDDTKNMAALIATAITTECPADFLAVASGEGTTPVPKGVPVAFVGGVDPAITTTANDIIAMCVAAPIVNAALTASLPAGSTGKGLLTAMVETHLSGGIDGTPGTAGDVMESPTGRYICTVGGGITEATWERQDTVQRVQMSGSLASDSGLAANRPAANAVRPGFIYYSVDTDVIEYSDGVQWVVM